MLKTREKVAYGLGDTASNIIFATVMSFITYFYTDVFGISAAVVGTMFLVVRIIDAVTDPLMGAFADKTETRWGRYRPYLVWLALPFAIISVLAFTTPDLSPTNKIIYAYFTYILLMLAYTAINIPYSALGGVLTGDPKERVSVQSYRFVCGMIGGLIVTALTLPLVEYFGAGDEAKGYQYTMAAMSVVGIVLFLLCFAGTKERVEPPADQKLNFKTSMRSLWQNDQWRILCVAAVLLLTGMVIRGTLAIYYVNNYLDVSSVFHYLDNGLVKFFIGDGYTGLSDSETRTKLLPVLVTVFLTIGMFGNIIGSFVAQHLANHVDKVKAYIGLQFIAAIICLASFFVAPEQVETAIFMNFIYCFFLQMATPLLWAKMADAIDYGHYKTGIRITGLVYSTVVFFIKLGLALGGAIAAWLLAYYNYDADLTQQSAITVDGILFTFTIWPAVSCLLVAFVMRWYKLNNVKVEEVHQELKARAC
ncbi:glycoside-pentoside-hexuronide (GPH):cation symporter [Neiella marina]|uniref:Glycoside-pentoside-hexuronide (GPH):cation symporter n=1 Tax=Neiella holothuriorum TaxID=2870530 RepID=A0ABS7EC04_9GAMM|nr:glycoside-pentoside-hexuronide (GPH):cation symporter [Neiella holothuriorum]MBW8189861.1 glycoside-pentoside-hexuronide (GPH):cation symporter [Neiella holothuriorum]